MNQNFSLYQQALQFIPGGVNSPIRAYSSVDFEPIFIKKACGSKIFDANNKEYIDYVGGYGAMIAGHNHPQVISAIQQSLSTGFTFGASHENEAKLAAKICDILPFVEQIRMVNSGTEATMSAARLARGYTGKNKIIKFIGCYHGHADYFLAESGSEVSNLKISSPAGVPQNVVQDTLLAPYNDLDKVKSLAARYANDIAGIIVEPVAGNMNLLFSDKEFLQGLRTICDQIGAVLIFDEVISGFRVALQGSYEIYNITPDLITLGKIIGGGLPVGAFGGKASIMQHLAPNGDVFQAGTLSGNGLAMASGIATLDLLSQEHVYENFNKLVNKLTNGIVDCAKQANIPCITDSKGALFSLKFGKYAKDNKIKNYNDINQLDRHIFNKVFNFVTDKGIFLAPSMFECGFISLAHSAEDIAITIDKFDQAFHMLNIK